MDVELVALIYRVAVVKLLRIDAITYDVSVCSVHRRPEEVGLTSVLRIAYCLEVIYLHGPGRIGLSEYAEVLHRELRSVMY